jgi:hypothetical protein
MKPGMPYITERQLVAAALSVQRPGRDFAGAVEVFTLVHGVPTQAVESVAGRVVARTEFRGGQPFIKRLDMDADGRMETEIGFRQERVDAGAPFDAGLYAKPVWVQRDADGDGLYEYREEFVNDFSSRIFWDFDDDGRYDTE